VGKSAIGVLGIAGGYRGTVSTIAP
jgi:hypothetical protein